MSGSSQSEKPASAAAMDALDLDDLFLEGDDGPSLFEDMEIDLGDMGNIFDAPPGGATAPTGACNQTGERNLLNQEFGRSNSTSSARGTRVRTAKTNPHLLAANEKGGSEQKRQSAIQKELQKLQESNESSLLGDTTSSKRKRRRSKKNQDEDEHKNKETDAASAKAGSKKKRRGSSKANTPTQQIDVPQPQPQPQPHLQQQQQALQQIFHQMTPEQQERLQKKAEAMGLNIFTSSSTNPAALQDHANNFINQQDKIDDSSLKPSTTFYPFCALPPELDIKRGQKIFPVLEKINSTSVPSSHHQTNTDTNFDHQQRLYSLNESSPLYTLFHQHLGLIQNSDKGISDLSDATKLTSTFMNNERGRKKMAMELSKLLSQCLKQSAFVKQNLSNLEAWVKKEGGEKGWSDADIHSLFPSEKTAAGTSASNVGAAKTDATGGLSISVLVKVRVPGWRDKSGTKLTAKLPCPPSWKVAMNREKLRAAAKKAEAKKVEEKKNESKRNESKKNESKRNESKKNESKKIESKKNESKRTETKKSDSKKTDSKKTSSENAHVPVSTTTKSTASRKRKAKENSTPAPTNKNAAVSNRGLSSKITVPFVSSQHGDQPNQEYQDSSILHNLYKKILRPTTSPAQRRELLANEISSTLSRLESTRLTQQWTKAHKLQAQMKALQAVYKDDMDIVPDMCNTIGMWRWIEHTNYFKEFEDENEVHQEFADCLGHQEEEMFESKGNVTSSFWGSNGLSEMRRVSNSTINGNEDNDKLDRGNDNFEPSPLFDRLQSLLVEVDGSDDDDEDDDLDLISSLPQFTPDQFIYGPNNFAAGEKEMIDVSALTLDQRTYIKLRAAGLIDASIPPSLFFNEVKTFASSSENSEDDSIDTILKRMNSHLSELTSGSNFSSLQRKVLSHAKQTSEQKKKERDEDAILAKYKQLQKLQKEQEEERKRSSSR